MKRLAKFEVVNGEKDDNLGTLFGGRSVSNADPFSFLTWKVRGLDNAMTRKNDAYLSAKRVQWATVIGRLN